MCDTFGWNVTSGIDLLPYLDDFSPEQAERCQRALASPAPVIPLSSRSGEGLEAWLQWLEHEVSEHKLRVQQNQTLRPHVQQNGQVLHAQGPAIRFHPVAEG